jgi:hypothetical protein
MELASRARHAAEAGNRDKRLQVMQVHLAIRKADITGKDYALDAAGSNPNKGIHLIRNPSTTERARVIDFLIAEKGQPIVISVK